METKMTAAKTARLRFEAARAMLARAKQAEIAAQAAAFAASAKK